MRRVSAWRKGCGERWSGIVSSKARVSVRFRSALDAYPFSAGRGECRGGEHALSSERIRVLSFIESGTVTGPSRVLIDFAEQARRPEPGLPVVDVTLATYQRGEGESNLSKAARLAGVPVIDIPERKR